MELVVHHTPIFTGMATPPSSKSQSIRALILALLARGESSLLNVLDSDDTRDAIRVCEQLGMQCRGSQVYSSGLPLQPQSTTLNTGNSGITTRLIMPLLGLRQDPHTPLILDCGEQMRARPIRSLVSALTLLGMTVDYLRLQGQFPVAISGHLMGGNAEVDGITSQYISALLIALPCAPQDSVITVKNLHERPYMEMTLDWLRQQGIQSSHQSSETHDIFYIQGKQRYQPFQTTIEGDFSSASYLIAAGAFTPGDLELQGLDIHSQQGDKRLVTLLQRMGAAISSKDNGLNIQGGRQLTGIKIDANDIPDLLPTLAVLGTIATGQTEIRNVKQARLKETDRIHSMTEGLRRLGARVDEFDDGMIVYQSNLKGTDVKGYGDHRTVMALALAGMIAAGETRIDEAESVHKTFPEFVTLMQSLGAQMNITEPRPLGSGKLSERER